MRRSDVSAFGSKAVQYIHGDAVSDPATVIVDDSPEAWVRDRSLPRNLIEVAPYKCASRRGVGGGG